MVVHPLLDLLNKYSRVKIPECDRIHGCSNSKCNNGLLLLSRCLPNNSISINNLPCRGVCHLLAVKVMVLPWALLFPLHDSIYPSLVVCAVLPLLLVDRALLIISHHRSSSITCSNKVRRRMATGDPACCPVTVPGHNKCRRSNSSKSYSTSNKAQELHRRTIPVLARCLSKGGPTEQVVYRTHRHSMRMVADHRPGLTKALCHPEVMRVKLRLVQHHLSPSMLCAQDHRFPPLGKDHCHHLEACLQMIYEEWTEVTLQMDILLPLLKLSLLLKVLAETASMAPHLHLRHLRAFRVE